MTKPAKTIDVPDKPCVACGSTERYMGRRRSDRTNPRLGECVACTRRKGALNRYRRKGQNRDVAGAILFAFRHHGLILHATRIDGQIVVTVLYDLSRRHLG